MSRDHGKQLDREIPLARHDAVEPLANRVGFDVRDEAREVLSVALDGPAILSPRDGTGGKRRRERSPRIVGRARLLESFLS